MVSVAGPSGAVVPVILGAFTRWFNGRALLIDWAMGAVSGTAMAIATNLTPTYSLLLWGFTVPGYAALSSR